MKIPKYFIRLNISLILLSFLLFSPNITVLLFSAYRTNPNAVRENADLLESENNITPTSNKPIPPRFLWCLNYHGPNNQLKGILKCSIIAIANNFTLVIPPLFPHYQDKTQGIQSFLHFYDLQQLSSLFKLITFENFIQQAESNQEKAVINCYLIQPGIPSWVQYHADITLKAIEDHYKTKIDFQRHLNLSASPLLKDVGECADGCRSVFLQIDYLTFGHLMSAQDLRVQMFFRHLHRTVLVRRMATHVISQLHKSAVGNYSRSNRTSIAVAHMRLGDRVVLDVPSYTVQILKLIQTGGNFTHLHVMCPYLTPVDINHLIKYIPVAITTTGMLIKHIEHTLDDYLFDVLEQEIAIQAAIFIASPWTTYSSTVVLQKLHQSRGRVYTFTDKGQNRTFPVTKENATYYFR